MKQQTQAQAFDTAFGTYDVMWDYDIENTDVEVWEQSNEYADLFATYFFQRLPGKFRALFGEAGYDDFAYDYTDLEGNDKFHNLVTTPFSPNQKMKVFRKARLKETDEVFPVVTDSEVIKVSDLVDWNQERPIYDYIANDRGRMFGYAEADVSDYKQLEEYRLKYLEEWKKKARKQYLEDQKVQREDTKRQMEFEASLEAEQLPTPGLGMLDKLERLGPNDAQLVRSLIDKLYDGC